MSMLSRSEFDAIRSGYDANPKRSLSLNASTYLDARFFQLERETIFRRSWQFVCHTEKLRAPGDYVAVDIQGQSVLVVLDDQQQLRAFYNVCKHRGHELVRGEGSSSLIVCPYHAWSYRLDGRLHRARRSENLENFDTGSICLTPVQVESFCSLVFVNLDPAAASLAQQSGGLGGEVLGFAPDIAGLTFAHRLSYRIAANWKAVIDNFLECYHCPVAHKDFCSLVDMDSYRVTTHAFYSSHIAKAGQSANTAYAVDGATVTDHAVWYLWPNTALMRYPGRGNFMVWRFIPVSETETLEHFDFFFETPVPSAQEQEAIRYIDEVLQVEDIALVESVQRGMSTPAFEQGRYVIDDGGSGMSEHAVHHFHGLVLDAYASAVSGFTARSV